MKPTQTTTYYIQGCPKNDKESDTTVFRRNLSSYDAIKYFHFYTAKMPGYEIEVIEEVKIERSVTLAELATL